MAEPTSTPPPKPRASASSTSAATAPKPPKPPADPLVGTQIAVGSEVVSIEGREYDVDPKTGTITGLRA